MKKNIIKIDFNNFVIVKIDKNSKIEIKTPNKSIYTQKSSWFIKENNKTINFYNTTGSDNIKKFINKSKVVNTETLFLFWIYEANLRYILINKKDFKIIEETNNLIKTFEQNFLDKIKKFKINKEENKILKLAKLRLISCCYLIKKIKENDLEKFLNSNFVYSIKK